MTTGRRDNTGAETNNHNQISHSSQLSLTWRTEDKIVKKTWKCCWNLINNFNEDRCASGKNGKIDKHKKQTVFDYEQGWSYVC